MQILTELIIVRNNYNSYDPVQEGTINFTTADKNS